jgi:uncharacterized protein Smg (DUF494 family)
MSEERERAAVQRLLGLLAQRLEEYLDGDEMALDSLGQALEQGEFSEDQIQTALLTLRSLAGESFALGDETQGAPPGRWSQRILSDQERESLSPEAWGYLLDLKRRGALDPGQLERVLDRLASSGARGVGVEMAHRVAVGVALSKAGPGLDDALGEKDVAH